MLPPAGGPAFRRKAGTRFVFGTNGNEDGVFERREIAAFAKLQLLLEVAGEIVMARELDRRRKGRVGLDKNFARRFAASGPAGDLSEKLEGPFARAEIGQVQREIGVDDPDKSDVRKVQTFRDHLRADEDVDLARAESVERVAVGVFARIESASIRLTRVGKPGRLTLLCSAGK